MRKSEQIIIHYTLALCSAQRLIKPYVFILWGYRSRLERLDVLEIIFPRYRHCQDGIAPPLHIPKPGVTIPLDSIPTIRPQNMFTLNNLNL
jgi:hypothetical protein